MNQLKSRNPQQAQQLEKLISSKGDPYEIFNQITSGYTDEQFKQLYANAKRMGIPDEVINQAQNGINSKQS